MIDLVLSFIMPAALRLLPPMMNTPAARAMVLAIGLQETRFLHRQQLEGGPARSFWQYERGPRSAIAGILSKPSTKDHVAHVLEALRYQPIRRVTPATLKQFQLTLEHNDVLACACARLLLWTLPRRLPARDEPNRAWEQYLEAWRPGRPHPETWDNLYAEAWTRVEIQALKEAKHEPGGSVGPVHPGDPSVASDRDRRDGSAAAADAAPQSEDRTQ